jgi:hypothetical protein
MFVNVRIVIIWSGDINALTLKLGKNGGEYSVLKFGRFTPPDKEPTVSIE